MSNLYSLLTACSHRRLTWDELLTEIANTPDAQDLTVRISGSEFGVPTCIMTPDGMCSARLRYLPGDDDTVMVSMHNFTDAIICLLDEVTDHGSNTVDFLALPVYLGTSLDDPDEGAFIVSTDRQGNVLFLIPHDDTLNGCYIDEVGSFRDEEEDDEDDEDLPYPGFPAGSGGRFNRS